MKTISVDAMGGDVGPSVTVAASLKALRARPDLRVLLVGLPDRLQPLLSKHHDVADRIEIVSATEVVAMDEDPGSALRQKKDSSLRVCIDLVKAERAQACVSAGNTGALMSTARFVLKTIPNVDRPAIMARFPTLSGKDSSVLDLGANVDSTPEQLLQFAVMGSITAQAVDGIAKPSVGLLNVGVEEIKGNEQVKKAAELFSRINAFHYIGFVEGDDLFSGKVDVIVCDGFVGNVMLKACEGMAKLISSFAREEFTRSLFSKLSALTAFPTLHRVKERTDTRKRNGATLLGLNGIVIKSHGGADEFAFFCALERAYLEVEKNIPALIGEKVAAVLQNEQESRES